MKLRIGKERKAKWMITVPLALLLVAVLSLLFYRQNAFHRAEEHGFAALEESIRQQSETLNATLEGKYEMLGSFASVVGLAEAGESGGLLPQMNAILENTEFQSLFYAWSDGVGYFSDGSVRDLSAARYYTEAMEEGVSMQRLEQGSGSEPPRFILALRIPGNGANAGVVGGAYSAGAFRALFLFDSYAADSYAFVCSRTGDIVIGNEKTANLPGENILRALQGARLDDRDIYNVMADLMSDKAGRVSYELDGQRYYAVYSPMAVSGWTIFRIVDDAAVRQEESSLMLMGSVLIGALLLGVTLLFGWIGFNERQHARQLALYRMMEDSGVFTAEMDDHYTMTYGNDKIFQILECTPQEFLERHGNHLREIVHPDDLDMLGTAAAALVADLKSVSQSVIRVRTDEGAVKHMLVTAIVKKRGDRLTFSGAAVDITEQKLLEAELRLQKMVADVAVRSAKLTIWEYDFATRSILQEKHDGRLHGYAPRIRNVPRSLIDSGYIQPDSVEDYLELYIKLEAGAPEADAVIRTVTDTGGTRYEHIRYTCLFDEDGKPVRAVGVSDDVTVEREQAMQYQREISYRRAMDQDVFTTVLLNVSKRSHADVQTAHVQELDWYDGLPMEEFFARMADSVVEDESVRLYFAGLTAERLLEKSGSGSGETAFDYLRRLADEREIWVHYEEHLLPDPESGDLTAFVYVTDIDRQKRKEQALQNAAERDSMTGLLNHDATLAHIRLFLQGEGRKGNHALLAIDLDNFKDVNDRLGHQEGDVVLMRVAAELRRLFRDTDIVGRVGGDEFLVLVKDLGAQRMIRRKALELLETLQIIASDGEQSVSVSGSVGIAVYRADDKDTDQLYKEADTALYRAKEGGKNRYSQYGLRAEPGEPRPEVPAGSGGLVQLKSLLCSVDGGILLYEVGEELHVLYASESFYALVESVPGLAAYDGRIPSPYIHPDDLSALLVTLREAAVSGEPATATYRLLAQDGHCVWWRLKALRVEQSDNPLPVLTASVTDVTALKRSAEQLAFSHEALQCDNDRLRLAFDQTRSVLWEVDIPARRFGIWDMEAQAIRPESVMTDIPGSLFAQGFSHPDSVAPLTAFAEALLAGRPEDRCTAEVRYLDTGQYGRVSLSYHTQFGEDGSPQKAVGVSQRMPQA